MKIFLDTNVLIDFLAERQPFYFAAASLFDYAKSGELSLAFSSLSVANSFYILRKFYSSQDLSKAFIDLRQYVEICGISSSDVFKALSANWQDGEDSIQHQAALSANCDFIITRNPDDFKKSNIPVMLPEEFLDLYFT